MCGADAGKPTAVDFIDKARQASWYPSASEYSPELEVVRQGLFWEASDFTFDLLSVKRYRYGDSFGYDIEDSEVVVTVVCPGLGSDGEFRYDDDGSYASLGATLSIVAGSIDVARVENATAADPEWGPRRFSAQASGREYYAYHDDDLAIFERRPVGPGRLQGFGGQLYVDESIAIRTASRYDLFGVIFDSEASSEQQAVHDDVIDIIEQLEKSTLVSARINNLPSNGTLPEELPVSPTRFINGTADNGAMPRAALAIYHETAADAAINADAILQSGRLGEIGGPLVLTVEDRLVTIVFEDQEGFDSIRLLFRWVRGVASD